MPSRSGRGRDLVIPAARPSGIVAALVVLLALAAPAAAAPDLLPLHATRGAKPAIVDSGGRQVLLRGVNVNQLGDYYQDAPELDPVVPLRDEDFAEIATLGFDVVRLVLSWSALEPERGAFDRGYVARVRDAVEQAKANGLYVVLDMHQDAWGKYVATPAGETCLPGFSPAIGWDGAPRWATFTDGLPTCRLEQREIAPAVAQAFTSFYVDRDGIQTALVRTWARLAREFAADPAVAGYDLLNEPHPGYTPGLTGPTLLGAFYGRAIRAIRAAERSVPGGFAHIAFFEPTVLWSATGFDLGPLPSFTSDRNIVFAPHLYADSISLDQSLGVDLVSVEQGFRLAKLAAAAYGTAIWSGEWGWFGDPAADRPKIAAYAREEDRALIGGAWWSWRQACGDPHVIGSPGARPVTVSPSLNRYACPEQTDLGIPESTRRILARAYPRAAPGRLESLVSDPAGGRLELRGADPDPGGSCRLEVWLPDGGGGAPALEAEGLSGLAVEPYAGGWLASGCASGAYTLRTT